LGKRLQDTLDELEESERQLMEDARQLADQLNHSSANLVLMSSSEARRVIADADITAYNASFSLPCREKIPRIMYVHPEVIRTGIDDPEIRIRGNFLDLGSNPNVKISGVAAKLIARSRNEVVVKIPEEVIKETVSSGAVPIELHLNRSAPWLWCFFEREIPLDTPLSIGVKLRPQTSYEITGRIGGKYIGFEKEPFVPEYYREDQNCDANFPDDQQFCLPTKEWTLDIGTPASLRPRESVCE
jgi:hypothetical protein